MLAIDPDVENFVEKLASLRFENAFNPYTDLCPSEDRVSAPEIRKRNLALILNAAALKGTNSFWIARDLGYRGGRRTGLAMTDDVHLDRHANLFGAIGLTPATVSRVGERTATVVWKTLGEVNEPVFLWNVFPFHPHQRDEPMTNRCHTRAEREACEPLLRWLIDFLKPKMVVAIGRDAQQAMDALNIVAHEARHPSYGGQREFVSTVHRLYGVQQLHQSTLKLDTAD